MKKYMIILVAMVVVIAGGLVFLYMSNQSQSSKTANSSLTPTVSASQPTKVPAPTAPPAVVASPTSSVPVVPSLTLTVSQPVTGSTVNTPSVSVKGTTSPGAEVFVNDNSLTADSKGIFSSNVTLEEGENYILVLANDDKGASAEQEILVTYTPK
jgi:hypothetical protein